MGKETVGRGLFAAHISSQTERRVMDEIINLLAIRQVEASVYLSSLPRTIIDQSKMSETNLI